MRLFKSTGIILVILTMLFTLIPATLVNAQPVEHLADVTHLAEAEALHELGLSKGTSTTSFVPSLEKKLNRVEGIALLLRLLGLEEDANNMTNADITTALGKYSDKIQVPTWAMKNVAYVVANDIVIGTSATKLSPLASLSGNAFSTMILRNLGYTVDNANFSEASILLETAGADAVASFGISKALTRDDAVVISIKALGSKYKDTGETVVQVLIDKGLFTVEKAREVLLPFGIDVPIPPTFKTVLTADKPSLPADNSSSTVVKFELQDYKTDAPLNESGKVKFESTLGEFDNDTVVLNNGVATAMLTSEYVNTTQDAVVTATIKEGTEEYINEKATLEIPFVANVQPNQGSSMLYGKSLTADRVILKFDRAVNVADYTNPDTMKIDDTKCIVKVRKQSTSANTGTNCVVRGLLPVAGDTSSLYVMLNVEGNPNNALRDNSQVWVSFTDKTKDTPVVREKSFNFMEVVRPTIKNIEALSYYSFKVIFNEPVTYGTEEIEVVPTITPVPTENLRVAPPVTETVQLPYSAENALNYKIDGVKLSDTARWGTTKLKVGTFDVLGQTDKRNEVIITLGKLGTNQVALPEGDHSLKCINVGDWAEPTDRNANDVEPEQDVDFTITNAGDAPVASIEVMSPEQFKLTFDKDVSQSAQKVANNIKLQRYSAITRVWTNIANAYAPADQTKNDDGTQDILVTKTDATADGSTSVNGSTNTYILECNDDWTKVLQSGQYYTEPMRLKLNGDTVLSTASGLGNEEANLDLLGAMKESDITNPTVTDINKTEGQLEGTSYDVTLSEPCKFNENFNLEGTTISQNQTVVPMPKVKFINQADISKIVTGVITATNAYDTKFTVTMQNEQILFAGDWKMELTNISDDVGNSASSITKMITVKDTTGFRVLWFFADTDKDKVVENADATDDDATGDYVYVKYSNPIAVSGQYAEAFKLSNYTINGSALPAGTTIDNSIEGFDDGRLDINANSICDSVTIKLPNGYLASKSNNANTINNISLTVKSSILNAKGEALNNETDIPHATPYVDDSVSGNNVMKPYFGKLGFLQGGNTTTEATRDYTLFTTPQKKSILTIGATSIGFNTTGNAMANCEFVINTTGLSVSEICDEITALTLTNTDVTIANTANVLTVTADNTGIAGNQILVSLK